MASSLFLRSTSVVLVISSYFLATIAFPSPSPSLYDLTSTGTICSSFFGSPVASDCQGILSSLPAEDLYRWFDFSLTSSTAADTVSLPWSNTTGSCALDINIQPGARNNVSWATISNIAQEVLSSCSSRAGVPGGWGIYADISVIISSTASTVQAIKKTKSVATRPTAGGSQQADPITSFMASFWEEGAGEFNITAFPGYGDTTSWYYPLTTYAPQTAEEADYCTPPGHEPTISQCFQKGASCCEGAVCANRLVGDTGQLGLVCVPRTLGEKSSSVGQ